jgi:type IV pilus assembly protein PilA
MLMTVHTKKMEKGFTLIELMIVVAIIGILAAIAIPQFASYRTKAFNSAALSDLKGARDAEEGLFADYQVYGASVATNVASVVAGVALTANGYIATATAGQSMPVTVSNNDKLQAVTDSTRAYASITAQHASGDKSYAAETDQTGIYQKSVTVGSAFAAIPATSAADVTTGYTAM